MATYVPAELLCVIFASPEVPHGRGEEKHGEEEQLTTAASDMLPGWSR